MRRMHYIDDLIEENNKMATSSDGPEKTKEYYRQELRKMVHDLTGEIATLEVVYENLEQILEEKGSPDIFPSVSALGQIITRLNVLFQNYEIKTY